MMLRALIFVGLVGLGSAGAAQAQGPDEIFCRDPGVHDGATLACGGNEIRLWNIAAPEAGTPEFDASKAALEDLVRFRDVRCRVRRDLSPRTDEAICYVGVRDLGERQVREGHATRVTD